MKLKELKILIRDSGIVRKLIFNRITYVVLIIAVLALGIQGFAATQTDGHVQGTVVDQNGDPVEGLTIEIRMHQVMTQTPERQQTTTDANGQFEFTDLDDLLEFRIVVMDGDRIVHNELHHNHFQGQNNELHMVVDMTTEEEDPEEEEDF